MVSPYSSRGVDPINVLLDLTTQLSGAPTLETALSAVTEAALLLLAADHASVRVLDPTHTTLLASARAGQGTATPQVTLRTGEGIAGWVLERGQGTRIDDVRLDTRFKRVGGQGFAIRSMVAAPLCAGGAAVGVLSASSATVGAFTERDERLAQLLANCSVPPIERARLERLATTDHLTLAFSAGQLQPLLRQAMDSADDGPSLLLIDLDDFKSVNDARGHAAGDVVLRRLADRVRELTRQLDVLVRRGGDEFVLIMPGATLEQARAVAERIGEGVGGEPFVIDGAVVSQTVSIGVAAWDGVEAPEHLEARADRALYVAKRQGRNRLAVSDVTISMAQ